MAYNKEFDDFYRNNFGHQSHLDENNLLLEHYPYSIKIELPRGGSWLECGIGSGRVVWRNRDKVTDAQRIVGFDYSGSALCVARELLPSKIMLVRGDISTPCFKDSSFDLITAFGTIQAVPKGQWGQVIRELMKLLKPQGRLGFSVHPFNVLEILRCLPAPRLLGNMVTKKQLARMLARQGFEGDFTIEESDIFLIVEKIYQLGGKKLPLFWGFSELPDTPATRWLTRFFVKYLRQLTVGHYWVTLRKSSGA